MKRSRWLRRGTVQRVGKKINREASTRQNITVDIAGLF